MSNGEVQSRAESRSFTYVCQKNKSVARQVYFYSVYAFVRLLVLQNNLNYTEIKERPIN
jgi:hypothetical protein